MINKILSAIVDILLIICLIVFICQLIFKIKVDVELEKPDECISINGIYHCRIRININQKKENFL